MPLLRTQTQDRSPLLYTPLSPSQSHGCLKWVSYLEHRGLLLQEGVKPLTKPLIATFTLGPLDLVSDPPEIMPGYI